ncbi:ankyrin protein [Fusarium heterosporum]|uniref:Ankyrin protein n=1 Tax=Fusarium heterosporum TaxID=42747 RepID=A0A8H5STR9_FUSHE|nr:ankyrin protein [Fusarium heterosporum]
MALIDPAQLCASISVHATSITATANKLADSLDRGDPNVLQLNMMAASSDSLQRQTSQFLQTLNSTKVVPTQLRDDIDRLLAACAGRMNNMHRDFTGLQPADSLMLNGSILTAYSSYIMIHSQLFTYFDGTLKNAQQDQSPISLPGRQIIEQAESVTHLVDKSKAMLLNSDTHKISAQLDNSQSPVTNTTNAPPPYMSTATSPISPRCPMDNSGRPKGSSFFRSLTSGLRSKPDPFASALCQAVIQGDEKQISGLISQGASVDGRNEKGDTPLKCAIKHDRDGAARLLLSAGAKFSSKSWSELPYLFRAASLGNLNVARVLIEFGASVSSKAASGQPHFVELIAKGSVNVAGIGFLLANGVDARTKDITGQEVIVSAVKKGSVELVRLLVEYGADVNVKDIVGNPVLVAAVESGDSNMTELLLSKGANTDGRTILGTTILEHAAGKRQFEVVKKLLAYGANPAGTDVHSQPILIKILRDALLKTNEKVEVIRQLLDNGADPDTIDAIWGLPAICHAVEMSKAPVVDEMLRRGAKTKVRMLAGQTLLTYSIDVNRRNHVKALLDYGVDVNDVDGLNRTPLTMALQRLDYNLTKMFMDHGADATADANKDAVKFIKALKRNDLLELLESTRDVANTSARPGRTRPTIPDLSEMPVLEGPPPSYELAAGKC